MCQLCAMPGFLPLINSKNQYVLVYSPLFLRSASLGKRLRFAFKRFTGESPQEKDLWGHEDRAE